jgi:hypothetical protein
LAIDEKSTVGTERRGQGTHEIVCETQLKQIVQHQDGECGIAASTTQAGTEGYIFCQAYFNIPYGMGRLLLDQAVGFDNHVVLDFAFDFYSRLRE